MTKKKHMTLVNWFWLLVIVSIEAAGLPTTNDEDPNVDLTKLVAKLAENQEHDRMLMEMLKENEELRHDVKGLRAEVRELGELQGTCNCVCFDDNNNENQIKLNGYS